MKYSFVIFVSMLSLGWAQGNFFRYTWQKPGICPRGSGTCRVLCMADMQCPGDMKCCGTNCGGRMCQPPARPASIDYMSDDEFPPEDPPVVEDSCPKPTGWVCSNACASDNNCPKNKKCCKTRCGGKICMRT